VFELPYIFESAEQVAQVMYDNQQLFAPDYERFKVLWFLSSPLSQCHTVKKPVLTVADFQGMKIRSAGTMETEGIRRLGGNPIGMPISELSFALQRGTVEGALTPYAALNSHKLIDIVHHITEINYSGALMAVLMNRDKWNALPDFAKAAIDQAATREFGLKAAAAFDREDRDNKKAAVAKGIQIHRLPDAEAVKMRDALQGIWEDWVKENQSRFPARDILDAVLKSAGRSS
jgi:TRAP-type C4-dicarboxylate transport system substrate-binding protein